MSLLASTGTLFVAVVALPMQDRDDHRHPITARRPVDEHVAKWSGPIWGLPNGVLPSGPIMGNGDFGVTLQTNNHTGCLEFWLGLNSMWGMPDVCESPSNDSDGGAGTYKPTAPYPRQQSLGGLTVCVMDPAFRAASTNFSASQSFANGVVEAAYTTAAGVTLSSRSVMHPSNKTIATSLAFNGIPTGQQHPAVSFRSWTTTLWVNATPTAAASSTRSGWDSATGTQYFSRVAIPGNTAARKLRQLHVVVGTLLLSSSSNTGTLTPVGTVNHTVIQNETAASAAGLPPGSVAVGAECIVPMGSLDGSKGRLVLLTIAKSNLDLGTNFSVDPLAAALVELQETATKISTVEVDNDAYWQAYWSQASVSLPKQPRIEQFWYAANHMMSSTSRPAPARFQGSTFPNLWGPWITELPGGACKWCSAYVTVSSTYRFQQLVSPCSRDSWVPRLIKTVAGILGRCHWSDRITTRKHFYLVRRHPTG